MIIREKYLKNIRPFYDKDLIKVLVGIRRAGKSVILNQIMNELKEKRNIDDKHIIYINFEDIEYSHINEALKLNSHIKEKIKDNQKYYLFFDEIQMIKDWERVINSFKATLNVSIFITGSNSNLLSGELATLLSGRYISFKIYPFSFKELIAYKNIKNRNEIEEAFEKFIMWGSMPQIFTFENELEVKNYLRDLYDSIVIKDIVTRYNIKNIDIINRIMEFIVTNPSQFFSPTRLSKQFESENRSISNETIYNYLEYISNSLIITKAQSYDIRGKRILTKNNKYYLTDLGLGQIKNSSKKLQKGAYLENIVYNELLNRGYEVFVGSLTSGEIDFIATRFEEKIYIQVCYLLESEETLKREFEAFNKINDNYPRYIISMDKLNFSKDGIIHKNIIDFLLEEN